MSLIDEMKAIAQSVINDEFGSIGSTTVTYKSQLTATTGYDPSAVVGSQVSSGFTSLSNIQMKMGYENTEIQYNGPQRVKIRTTQGLLAGLDMGSVVPQPGDEVVDGSTTWKVTKVDTDGSRATYLCHLRTPT